MKRIYLVFTLALLAGCGSVPNFLVDLPLIGGKLGDFKSVGDAEWQLEDGVMSPVRGEAGGFVYTKEIYTDFDMTLEVFMEAGTNSGVYARCDVDTITPASCYEFNIWDENSNPDNRTGAIVNISPPAMEVSTSGKWNTVRVRVEDDHLQFWINDNVANDIRDDKFASGIIVLQYGGGNGMVRFRDIQISKL